MKLGTIFHGQLSSTRWHTRFTLWLAAMCTGLFARLAELALSLFFAIANYSHWLPFLVAPALGMAVVWLTRQYSPGSQGSGIPQVIAATRLAAQGHSVSSLVSLRIALGKIGLGTLALVAGFSTGREGPSVQVAASVMHFFHRFLPNTRALRPADLILAGGAAGIAAAFNTPLAGIVFAVEELGRRLEARTSGVLLSTVIISGLMAIAMQGNYNYFGHLKVSGIDQGLIIPIVVGGCTCGLLGGLFSRMLLWPQRHADWHLWRWRRAHPVLFAGACGLVVAVLGLISGGMSYGSGYGITSHVVSGEATLPWHAFLTRFFATVSSYYSGIPGGIFAPSLAVGAGVGATAARLLGENLDAVPVVALCMAGFLAAVTQSPITSAIIVMEMIDGHSMVISLMAVALIAKVVSSRFSPELYQQLAHGFVGEPRHLQATRAEESDEDEDERGN